MIGNIILLNDRDKNELENKVPKFFIVKSIFGIENCSYRFLECLSNEEKILYLPEKICSSSTTELEYIIDFHDRFWHPQKNILEDAYIKHFEFQIFIRTSHILEEFQNKITSRIKIGNDFVYTAMEDYFKTIKKFEIQT